MTRERSTQLRARFPMPGGRLRVVWWISNPTLSLDELVEDATDDLRDVLVDEHLQLVGHEAWHITSRWTLVVDLDVEAWLDTRRDASRRSTTT